MDNAEAGKCPLCNTDNHCAVAAGESAETCWCRNVSIAPAALAALPTAERGLRCICPACAGSTEEQNIER